MKVKFILLSFVLGMSSLNGFSQKYIYVPGGVSTGIKASNNSYVGIGTATPKTSLHVEGSIYLPYESSLWIGNVGDDSNRLRATMSNIAGYATIDYYPTLHFRTGATNSGSYTMTLLSNGNVGICETNPTQKLHVAGNGCFSGNLGVGISSPATKFHVVGNSYFNGNVGIGVASPATKLHVVGNSYFNGNVGIGVASPLQKFQIGTIWTFHDGGTKYIGRNVTYTSSGNVRIEQGGVSSLNFGDGSISLETAGTGAVGSLVTTTGRLILTSNGNVGIGTTSPGDYKLKVNGKINCTELVVSLGGLISREEGGEEGEIEWPDYVFAEDYNLQSLDDVASYIEQNKRLPEMPSAAEVAENGVNIGEINALLLKKVEELTLYILQQNGDMQALKEEVRLLKEGR